MSIVTPLVLGAVLAFKSVELVLEYRRHKSCDLTEGLIVGLFAIALLGLGVGRLGL
jgi:hypothetical protein